MIRIPLLIFCLTLMLFFCEKPKNQLVNRVDNGITKNEDSSVISKNSDIEWRNVPGFTCGSSVEKNKIWLTTANDRELIFSENAGSDWSIIRGKSTTICVEYIDENIGWLIDNKKDIWSTSDGGRNWTKKNQNTFLSTIGGMNFIDASNGWILDAFNLFYTSDGGNSWTAILKYKDKYLKGQPDNFFFLSPQMGWVCDAGDESGRLYKTTNAGKSWLVKRVVKSSPFPCEIFFIDSKEGWYSLGPNQTFQSKDGGENWKLVSTLPQDFEVRSMYWLSSNEGWLAGFVQDNKNTEPQKGKATLLKTDDGGKSWRVVNVEANQPFFEKIYFSDLSHGWLLSRDNFFITSDGGKTWNLSYSLPPLKD